MNFCDEKMINVSFRFLSNFLFWICCYIALSSVIIIHSISILLRSYFCHHHNVIITTVLEKCNSLAVYGFPVFSWHFVFYSYWSFTHFYIWIKAFINWFSIPSRSFISFVMQLCIIDFYSIDPTGNFGHNLYGDFQYVYSEKKTTWQNMFSLFRIFIPIRSPAYSGNTFSLDDGFIRAEICLVFARQEHCI